MPNFLCLTCAESCNPIHNVWINFNNVAYMEDLEEGGSQIFFTVEDNAQCIEVTESCQSIMERLREA